MGLTKLSTPTRTTMTSVVPLLLLISAGVCYVSSNTSGKYIIQILLLLFYISVVVCMNRKNMSHFPRCRRIFSYIIFLS